jgi:uncharacterized protein YqfA (UPF0365 family)
MVDWKEIAEAIYALLIIVSVIAVFSLYPSLGLRTAAVAALVVAFFEAIVGYILFEKVIPE